MSSARANLPPSVHLITLGCPKNQVDSEGMSAVLTTAGYRVAAEARQADVVIVNTCGFIAAAERRVARGHPPTSSSARSPGQSSCSPAAWPSGAARALADGVPRGRRRHRHAPLGRDRGLPRRAPPRRAGSYWLGAGRELPNVNRVGGFGRERLPEDLRRLRRRLRVLHDPAVQGRARGKPADRIVAEARDLAATGRREVILIGQDTTGYGRDLGERDGLAVLLDGSAARCPSCPGFA